MTIPDPKKDAFAEGADAYLAGESESANPYDVECDDHLNWNDGWNSQADKHS